MRAFEVDWLSREHLDGTCPSGQLVVWQVRMEIEGRDVPQEAKAVEVVEGRQRSDFSRALYHRWPKAIGVVHEDAEPLHQRAGVLPKPLLARHETVAMVEIFHLALLHVVGEADIMMGREQKAGVVPLQPFAQRLDLLRRRLLLGQDMIEPEHHEGVGVGENAFIDWLLVTGLIDALENSDWMARRLAGDLLETEGRAVKQLKRSRDALKELRGAPLRRLVGRPQDIANLGHSGEAVLHRRRIALRLPGIAPRPVDAYAPLAGGVFARNVILVVGPGESWR